MATEPKGCVNEKNGARFSATPTCVPKSLEDFPRFYRGPYISLFDGFKHHLFGP